MNSLICILVLLPAIAAQQCGLTYSMGSRVISGHDAKSGAWPWQALFYENGGPMCGGTLIDPNWVLSAAHCFKGKEGRTRSFKVVLGDHQFNKNEGHEQVFRVRAIYTHSRFSFSHFDSDIALVRLSTPARLNSRVNVACLPKSGENAPPGTECYITGFGKINPFGRMHPVLQQARIPVVSNQECSRLNYRNTRIRITKSMICAGHGGRTSVSGCHGDSGGPFVCKTRSGQWQVQGAVSWGSKTCSARQTYTVFARVAELRPWIDQIMRFSG